MVAITNKVISNRFVVRLLAYVLLLAVGIGSQYTVTQAQARIERDKARIQTERQELIRLNQTITSYRNLSLRLTELANQGVTLDEARQLQQTALRYLQNGQYPDAERMIQASRDSAEGQLKQKEAVPIAQVEAAAIPASEPAPAPTPAPAPKPVAKKATPTPKPVQSAPLATPKPSPSASLSISGILHWTNIERRNHGLPEFVLNSQLNQAAAAKVNHMVANQYFAHIAPDGTSYTHFVNNVGYQWTAIAENIAAGSAGHHDSKAVVDLWMNSPGHRANILSPAYTEIGIGVITGAFLGEQQWVAAQIFGHP